MENKYQQNNKGQMLSTLRHPQTSLPSPLQDLCPPPSRDSCAQASICVTTWYHMMLKCASLYDHMIPSEYEYASVRAKCPCLASYILYLPKRQQLQNSEAHCPWWSHSWRDRSPPTPKGSELIPRSVWAEVTWCF